MELEASTVPLEDPHAVDPRENEEWFQRLPDAVQEEFRAEWRRRREKDARLLAALRHERRATVRNVALLFFFIHLILAPYSASWIRPFAGALLGGGIGLLWARLEMGRFQSMLSGAAAHLVFCALWGDYAVFFGPSRGMETVISVMFPLLAIWLLSNLCAVSGLQRERLPGS